MVKLFLAKSSHSYDLSYRQRMCLFRRDKRIELLNDSWAVLPERLVHQQAETGYIAMNRRCDRSRDGRNRLGGRRGFDGRSRRHNCTIRWRLCGGGLCTGSFIAMGMSMVAML